MLATYRSSFAPIDASATASANTRITTSLVPSLGVLAWRLLRIRITQASVLRSAVTCVNGHADAEGAGPRPALSVSASHRPRLVGVGEQAGIRAAAADELPHLWRPPGVAIRPPRRLERIVPEVRRRERERIEELDLAVGHHQQHRLRRFEPRLDLGDDVPRVDRQRRLRAGRRRALRERSHGLPPVLVTARGALPIVRGAPEAHQRAGDERAAAERRGAIEGRDDLVQVKPGGHKHPLRFETPGGETLDGANRRGKARTRAYAIVRGGGGPVHRDLDAPDCERLDPVGGHVVDATAVGLDLECNPVLGEDLEELPAMRHAERLAAAECRIGDAELADATREIERLLAPKLIRPSAVWPGLLAARDTLRVAAVGQLPSKKKRRPVLVERTPRCCARRYFR